MNDERWARRVFRYATLKGVSTQWSRRLYDLCRKFSLLTDPVQEDSERKWSLGVRTTAMDQKSSLALYRVHKTTISVERLYDNAVSSALLFQTRAGALRTKVYRLRFDQSADDKGTTLPEPLGFVEARNDHNTNVHPLLATSITEARLLKWW
ncbi:hypothetical protein HPB49_024935 [Dermacentor silvarum]|uniref:Uncharacterized protein n=1 Tax=Dermacentor silvarum TaxID=543639 RepID=A0ACB8CNK4_DERSI|nr:hypothetical protein HPB49_024935 [Dermacentor silvarum]